MGRIWLAIRVFFLILFKGEVARKVAAALANKPEPAAPARPLAEEPKPKAEKAPKPARATRSEALTLLATLQREARFVDFVQEKLDGFSDAQIGAAARDVHRDCGKVLQRLFELKAIVEQEEGSPHTVPAGFDAGCYRLTGNVSGDPPFQGRLMHHGWEASVCQLPAWTGSEQSVRVVAPVEVEL